MPRVKLQTQIYKSYQKEILYLRKQGDKLLQEIKRKEIKMNQKKQKKLPQNPKNLLRLNNMIKKLLRMLGLIDSYRYFQIINEPLTYENQNFLYQVANDYYEDLLHRFLLKLKKIRSIDFTVTRLR